MVDILIKRHKYIVNMLIDWVKYFERGHFLDILSQAKIALREKT